MIAGCQPKMAGTWTYGAAGMGIGITIEMKDDGTFRFLGKHPDRIEIPRYGTYSVSGDDVSLQFDAGGEPYVFKREANGDLMNDAQRFKK